MSGGIVPGTGRSLAERAVAGRAGGAEPSGAVPEEPAPPHAEPRDIGLRDTGLRDAALRDAGLPAGAARVHGATHCWVQDPPDAPGRWPGLLLRWSRGTSGGWRGQVAYAYLRGPEVVLVEAWLDADLLRRR